MKPRCLRCCPSRGWGSAHGPRAIALNNRAVIAEACDGRWLAIAQALE